MKNSQKGSVAVWVAIIIIIIAGGAYFYHLKAQSPAPVSSTSSTEKTYSDPTYGFSFDYPVDWQVSWVKGAQNPTLIVQSPEHAAYVKNNPSAPYQGQYQDIAISIRQSTTSPATPDHGTFNGMDTARTTYSGVYESESYTFENKSKTQSLTLTTLLSPNNGAEGQRVIRASFKWDSYSK